MLNSIIGKSLKSDEIIELLEAYQIEVVYDFDRLNENTPDKYWASSPKHGFEIGFSEQQVADVVFIHVKSSDKFDTADCALFGVVRHESLKAALEYCSNKSLLFETSSTEFLGKKVSWIKISDDNMYIHYQFDDSLSLITLMLR